MTLDIDRQLYGRPVLIQFSKMTPGLGIDVGNGRRSFTLGDPIRSLIDYCRRSAKPAGAFICKPQSMTGRSTVDWAFWACDCCSGLLSFAPVTTQQRYEHD